MKYLIILLSLLPVFAHADFKPDKLIVGGFSYHFDGVFDTRYEFNEKHKAIGLEFKDFEIGAYENSVYKTSYFIAHIKRPWKITDSLSAGYRFGLASGYESIEWKNEDGKIITTDFIKGGIFPQAQFLLSHESKYITVDLGISVVSTLNFKLNL